MPTDAADTAIGPQREEDFGFHQTLILARPEEELPTELIWPVRAAQIEATTIDRVRAAQVLTNLWMANQAMYGLTFEDQRRLTDYLAFFSIPAQRNLVLQDESSDFIVIIIEGAVSLQRSVAGGMVARLGQAQPGALIGHMAMLDAGASFATCATLTPTTIAMIDAPHFAEMRRAEPHLALALLSTLARQLSHTLRDTSAHLSILLRPR